MTTLEVGRALGIGSERVRQLAKSGQLPSIQTGGGIRVYERADVERLRREREKKSAAA